jgi:hypothetical protein
LKVKKMNDSSDRASAIERIRQHCAILPPGPVADLSILERLIAAVWDDLSGDDGGMEAHKLSRMENPIWNPPVLTFRIERHGGTVLGSSRAVVQEWTVDLERLTADLDAEIRAVDGDEAKVGNLLEGEGQVAPVPEYLIAANAGRIIEEGDVVLACTSNQSTLKLISAHVQKLANVTVVAGGCDYLDRAVMFFVRRKGKNLTLPLASHYHPELLKPTDRNPGEVAVDKTMPPSTPKAVVNVNMVAAVMLAALRRLMTEEFPDPCEFYIEANLPRVVLRERFPSKSERRNSAGNLRLPADHRMQPVLGTEERGLARRGGSEWWKISGFVCQMWECPTTFRIVGRQSAIGGLQIHDCRWRIGSVEKFGKQP